MGGRTLSGMGVIRKLTSAVTLGAVDFRSDKERTALYTRQTRNAVEAQTRKMEQAARDQRIADAAAAAHERNAPKIQELKARAAAAQDLVDRIRSSDPEIRAAALDEWKREHVTAKDG